MKKVCLKITRVLVLLMVLNLHSLAQVDSVRIIQNQIFANINKSQIPTGFLDEYGAQFADLKTFNGVLTDSNIVDALAWQYIYASVYTSKIYGTNTLLIPDSIEAIFTNAVKQNINVNPVSLLALNYSSLKPNAMELNLFTINNDQLYDVPGRTQSPYVLNTAFAATPFYDSDNDGKLSLIFKQNLFFNTTGKTVSNIQVNFDDGNGFITTAWDAPVNVNYTTAGVKKLTFKLSFADGSNLQCYSNVNILNAYSGAKRYQATTVTTAFNPTNNNHSGGDITVQYSVNNTTPTTARKFQKPFIVVEGFDMHDAAPLLMDKGYSYNDFLNEISSVFFSNGKPFDENLDDIAGYDLIFVNYRDGTDDILRNAALLEEVINWVNSSDHKDVGAQQNVIMGISMGGLVARYCLAKMTKAGINPQTRLLLTHDSPHRGANIPLGAQYIINDFAASTFAGLTMESLIPMVKQAVKLQKRPATIQQLIVRYNPLNGNTEYNTFLASGGAYRSMVDFLPGNIQPAYKFIATSQGSQCGVQVMPPSQLIATTSGEVKWSFVGGFAGTKYSGEIIINALPNGTASQRVAYMSFKKTVRALWIIKKTRVQSASHNSPVGILGYDGCPGGTQSLSRGTGLGNVGASTQKAEDWYAWLFNWVIKFNGLQVQPNFTFLPTVSALDENNITATSLYASHIGALYSTPTNLTVLQKYVAQEKSTDNSGSQVYNIPHTDFRSRNAQWIFNEMQNINNDCMNNQFIDECYTAQISGSSIICTNNTYTISNLPVGLNVSWSVSPANIVSLSTTNGSSTTLIKNGNGIITLTATINSNCTATTITASKIIEVGIPTGSISFRKIGTSCYYEAVFVTTQTQNSYEWSDDGIHYTNYGTTNNYGEYLPRSGANVPVWVRVTNACGTVIIKRNFTIQTVSGACTYRMAARTVNNTNIKNSDPVITFITKNAEQKIKISIDLNKIKAIKILDMAGREYIQTLTTGKRTINAQSLSKGIYILQIFDGNQWVSQRVSVL